MKTILIFVVLLIIPFKSYSLFDSSCNPDSTISYYFDENNIKRYKDKTIYSYNDKGFLINQLKQKWNSKLSTWDNESKIEKEYNQYGAVTIQLLKNWNSSDKTWIDAELREYEYSYVNILAVEQLKYFNNIKNKWELRSRFEYKHLYASFFSQIMNYYCNTLTNEIELTEKFEYKYDDNFNLKLETLQTLDSKDTIWQKKYKIENVSDTLGLQFKTIFYKSSSKNDWLQDSLIERNYVESSLQSSAFVSENLFKWDYKWIKKSSFENTLDSTGKVIIESKIVWDINTKEIIKGNRTYFDYDTNYRVTETKKETWDSIKHNWVYLSKSIKSYSNFGSVLQIINLIWNISLNDWLSSEKYDYEYNNMGLATLEVNSKWDSINNNWLYNYRTETTYFEDKNTLEQITTHTSQIWDKDKNSWINSFKYEFQRLIDDIYTRELTLKWDANSNKWINYKIKIVKMYKFECLTLKDISENWDTTKNIFKDHNVIENFYSSSTSDVSNVSESFVARIYPNPSKNVINLNLVGQNLPNEIEIIDINGNFVLKSEFKSIIDVSKLVRGTYFLNINNKSYKFLKE